jgi:hypothetical protein
VQHEFGAVELEAGRQRRAGGGGDVFEAEDLAAAVAVEVRMAMRVAAADLEAPGALAAGDALRDALFDQPVERAVEVTRSWAMASAASAAPISSCESGCDEDCSASITATRVRVTRPPWAAMRSRADAEAAAAGG